jgi:L-fuconolactonase
MPPEGPSAGPLREDYLADRLLPELEANGVAGTILVQAAQTVAETEFLLDFAAELEVVLGVTGWVDLGEPSAVEQVAALASRGPMVAVRPMLHDLEDPAWILQAQVRENLAKLVETGQRFEVLSFTEHLPAAYEALAAVPDLPVVIDHLSKPTYVWESDDVWRTWMSRFAKRPGTWCKLSGIVTEIGDGWSVDRVRPYAEFVFDTFGPDRVLFGSDWPVCRQVAEYAEVIGLADRLTRSLDPAERRGFWHDNAARFYDVQIPEPTPPGAAT